MLRLLTEMDVSQGFQQNNHLKPCQGVEHGRNTGLYVLSLLILNESGGGSYEAGVTNTYFLLLGLPHNIPNQ